MNIRFPTITVTTALLLLASILWLGQRPVVPACSSSSEGIAHQLGVTALAVAPGAPERLYAAAYDPRGLYRSGNGGQTWYAINQGLEQFTPLALAVDTTDADRVYVDGTLGAYRSQDGGAGWQPLTGLPETHVCAPAVSGSRLYIGGEGMGVY
ncbi:MAG TPA: hypothetical protein EYH31_03070 [Anaerolineae bacterium]|nr:hypothetical protein [Anaerolineae bacterium]